jgi:surface antigen
MAPFSAHQSFVYKVNLQIRTRFANAAGLYLACALCVISGLCAGCSITLPIASSLIDPEPEVTGSLSDNTISISPLSPDLNEEDWRRASAALNVALDPHGNGASVSWDNPVSHLKGSFIPTTPPYLQREKICRNFTAILSGKTILTNAKACRLSGQDWVIEAVANPRKQL